MERFEIALPAMNALDLTTSEVAYELTIRQVRELPLMYTASGYLNILLRQEREAQVDVLDPDEFVFRGNENHEVETILRATQQLRNWCFDRIVARQWFNASMDQIHVANSRLLHYYHRIQRLPVSQDHRRVERIRHELAALEEILVMAAMAGVQEEPMVTISLISHRRDQPAGVDRRIQDRTLTPIRDRRAEQRTPSIHLSQESLELVGDTDNEWQSEISGPSLHSTAHAGRVNMIRAVQSPINGDRRNELRRDINMPNPARQGAFVPIAPVPLRRAHEQVPVRRANEPAMFIDVDGRPHSRLSQRSERSDRYHQEDRVERYPVRRADYPQARVQRNEPHPNSRQPYHEPERNEYRQDFHTIPRMEQSEQRRPPMPNNVPHRVQPDYGDDIYRYDRPPSRQENRPNDRINPENPIRGRNERMVPPPRENVRPNEHNRWTVEPNIEPEPRLRSNLTTGRVPLDNTRAAPLTRRPSVQFPNEVQSDDDTEVADPHVTRYASLFGQEVVCDREANQANTFEQQALRRWLHNRDFNGETTVDDKSTICADTFLTRLREYHQSQRTKDRVILQNVAQSLTGQASKWWEGNKHFIVTLADFEEQVRLRFAPETRDPRRITAAFYNRKQGPDEFLLNYLDDMFQLYSRIRDRLTEAEAIDIIVEGVNDRYTPTFVERAPTTLLQLRTLCTNLVAKKPRPTKKQYTAPTADVRKPHFQRKIHELEVVEETVTDEDTESEEIERLNEIAAMQKYTELAKRAAARKTAKPAIVPSAVAEKLPNPIPDNLFKGRNGEKQTRCWNCFSWGHNHYACPFEMKLFCYGCGAPDVHIDDCKMCKLKPATFIRPKQPKNGQPRPVSAN